MRIRKLLASLVFLTLFISCHDDFRLIDGKYVITERAIAKISGVNNSLVYLITGQVLNYDDDDKYIVAYQIPEMDFTRLSMVESMTKNEQDSMLCQYIDMVHIHDCYWIIRKTDTQIFGPMSISEFQAACKKYNVRACLVKVNENKYFEDKDYYVSREACNDTFHSLTDSICSYLHEGTITKDSVAFKKALVLSDIILNNDTARMHRLNTYHLRSALFKQLNYQDSSAKAYEQVLKLTPHGLIDFHIQQAEKHIECNRFSSAKQHASQAIRLSDVLLTEKGDSSMLLLNGKAHSLMQLICTEKGD